MMKRFFVILADLALTLSLAACNGQPSASTSSPASTPDAPPPQQSESSTNEQNPTSDELVASTDGKSGDPIVNIATLEDFEKHPGDTEHMKPITEDYFYYQTTNTPDDVVLIQQIHSYDEQGNCCGDAIKTVYSSEAAAKSQYDNPMYDAIRSNITLDGAVFYQTTEGGCGNQMLDDLEQFHWWQKYGGDTEKEFFSIPIE